MSVTKCLWCGRAFTPRTTGGSPAKFCSAAHRKAYHSAVRHRVEAEIVGGRLTVAQIRNGAACTLATAAASPARGSAIEDPAPVAPAERPGEAAELLSDLLDVLFGLPRCLVRPRSRSPRRACKQFRLARRPHYSDDSGHVKIPEHADCAAVHDGGSKAKQSSGLSISLRETDA